MQSTMSSVWLTALPILSFQGESKNFKVATFMFGNCLMCSYSHRVCGVSFSVMFYQHNGLTFVCHNELCDLTGEKLVMMLHSAESPLHPHA